MNKSISVAVIGYGYWGPNLIRNFLETDGAQMAMCCDLDRERLARAASRNPGIHVTTEYQEVLKNRNIDAVALATPVATHFQLGKAALEAGKHVVIEKPMCLRADHCEELIDLANKKGVVLMVDHVYVYNSAVEKMKEILDSGKLGKLFYVDSVRINLGLFQHDVNVVWDLAPHDLSIVDYLVGKPPKSVAAFGSVHASHGIEDVAYLNLDFGEGLVANFHVNWLSPVKVRHMLIGGSEQSLIYNDLDSSEKVKVYNRGIDVVSSTEERRQVLISYRSGDVWSPKLSNEEALYRMTGHFISCIREGKRPRSDGEAGLRVVKTLEAAQRSIKAQGGRVVL
jgi:predicted dehydrogenase